jgi:hypothetical protein
MVEVVISSGELLVEVCVLGSHGGKGKENNSSPSSGDPVISSLTPKMAEKNPSPVSFRSKKLIEY